MSQHNRALGAARIILAGTIVASAEGRTVRLRAGENVMPVRGIAAPIVDVALFGQCRLFGQIVGSVQFGDILCDGCAFGIHPRSFADTVAGVHSPGALCRQISVPGFRTRSDRTRKLLAMTIGASEPAEIRAFAWPDAGDEKRHTRLLSKGGKSANQHHARRERCANSNNSHEIPPVSAETRRLHHREGKTPCVTTYSCDHASLMTHPIQDFPAYCASVTGSSHVTCSPPWASCMAICSSACSAVAPCQCFSPGGIQTVSPARISRIEPPQVCTRPTPDVTKSVCPSGWVCQAVRAPGSNRTQADRIRAGSGAWMMGSCQTVPVKLGGPIRREGRDPQAIISMLISPCRRQCLASEHSKAIL